MPTLDWIGKKNVITHHTKVPYRVLKRIYSFDEKGSHRKDNGSENMIIHGDNLEALKALLPIYEGKIQCIYIDPPYNTGKEEWIYSDNVSDPRIQKWLNEVVGREGEDFSRHDKWLCMMYPRLVLLRKLMAPDGVIFVSIDSNEQATLRIMMDDIFGSNNFLGTITWESSTQPANVGDARFSLQKKTEFIHVYRGPIFKNFIVKANELESNYPHQGRFGACRLVVIEKSDIGGDNRETMKFKILGRTPRPGKRWQIGEETARELEKLGRFEIEDGIVKRAIYPEDEADKVSYEPFWGHFSASEVGSAKTGKAILTKILGAIGFDTVKPPQLIENLISHMPANSVVLDSFAGSGTTMHAVLNMNKADGGKRKFIGIELCDYADEITAERVKRVIQGYGEPKEPVEGTGGSFSFYELGDRVILEDGSFNETVAPEELSAYVWETETHTPFKAPSNCEPGFLGIHEETAFYFFYDKKKLNTLNRKLLSKVKHRAHRYVIFADATTLSDYELDRYSIVFKKITRDVIKN